LTITTKEGIQLYQKTKKTQTLITPFYSPPIVTRTTDRQLGHSAGMLQSGASRELFEAWAPEKKNPGNAQLELTEQEDPENRSLIHEKKVYSI
jgi:hypothetical protein